jgi:hypothetical protein
MNNSNFWFWVCCIESTRSRSKRISHYDASGKLTGYTTEVIEDGLNINWRKVWKWIFIVGGTLLGLFILLCYISTTPLGKWL